MEATPASTPERLHIDVCPCGDTRSLAGYPKYAKDEAHAHLLAEEAVAEVLQVADPGEYFVVVSQNGQSPVSTQVVVVPRQAQLSSSLSGYGPPGRVQTLTSSQGIQYGQLVKWNPQKK